jgi:single-stranded-DNA-specific exonuclease
MGQVEKAVDLFLSTSYKEAIDLAATLDSLNRERQTVEREIFRNAMKRAEGRSAEVILLADEAWHPGVIGIVASRLVEELGKPAFLIALREGRGKGSCRSLPVLDVYDALTHCADLLEAYGGHSLAGGFQIKEDAIDALDEKINAFVRDRRSLESWKPTLDIDSEIYLSSITRTLLSEIDRLRPFGEGNPVPVFIASGLEIAAPPQAVGRDRSHLIFRVRQAKSEFKAVAFGQGAEIDAVGRASRLALAFTPRLSFYNGMSSIELHVKDIKIEA